MKLYYAKGACSLADHIALLEAGLRFETEAVDIHTKRTRSGADFHDVNPKGYVPALVLDSGEIITENIAVLDWIAEQNPVLKPMGNLARTRVLEMLTFISTEIHRAFKTFWHDGAESEKLQARETLATLLEFTATQMRGDYLFGDTLSVADCYLFVMLRWAEKFGIAVPQALLRLQWRMEERSSVQAAIAQEQLFPRNPSSTISDGVRENSEEHRFEKAIHDAAVAAAYYRPADDRLVFIHTVVPPEFSGLGIGTALARGTFELLRESGRKAVLECPFLVHFIMAHPEYADVVEA